MKTRLGRVEGAVAVIQDGGTVRPSGFVGITTPDELPGEPREDASAHVGEARG